MAPATSMLEVHCERCGWRARVCRPDASGARASLALLISDHLRESHGARRADAQMAADFKAELCLRATRRR